MFVIDDIAIAAAEVAVDTEIAAEVATEVAPEAAEGISSVSPETLVNPSDISYITGSEPGIIGDNIGEITETLDNPSDISDITGSEQGIIGDNIGEIKELDPSNTSFEGSVEIKGDEVGESTRTIKTINDGLVGQNHPDTGVPYVGKEVVTDAGEKVKGVFPQFESKIDIQLPEELQQAPDRTQFAECNKQLQKEVATNSELRSVFTEDQLADIEDGYTPEGYTWHHNEEIGKMQLVDSDIHSQTRHTGGRNIWGGGTEYRH